MTIPEAQRPPLADVREGHLVTSLDHRSLGIGRLVRRAATSTVEFMRAPDDLESVSVQLRQLRRAEPPVGARAFWRAGGEWRHGRVEWTLPGQYRIRVSNGSFATLREEDLFIRAEGRTFDPGAYVRHLVIDPVRSYRIRSAWVEAWLAQSEATGGLDAVLSSAVNLHSHQLLVVSRVLHDPIQRYLLADEVGLGKTIEAGIILRQYLLEEPHGTVVVLAPAALIGQWEEELDTKHLVGDFPEARIEVIDVSRVKAYSDQGGVGLVIVDEVHRIAQTPAQAPFESVRRLAHRSERLLLLSATPILHNEQGFLAMLHLLAPDIYKLDEVEAFKRQLARRTDLGLLFYTFTAAQPDFQIRSQLSQLRQWFGEDEPLTELLDAASSLIALGGDVDPVERASAIQAIRVHLSETYRVHSRLLRTRRTEVAKTEHLTRGRTDPRLVPIVDDLRLPVLEHVDAWREALHEAAINSGHTLPRQLLAAVLPRAGSALWLLGALARFRLEGAPKDRVLAGLGSQIGERIRGLGLAEGERVVLESLVELLGTHMTPSQDDPRIAAVVNLSTERDVRGKSVAFSAFPKVAEMQAHALTLRHGLAAVAYFGHAVDVGVASGNLSRFREDPDCRFLVCDGLAGEGVNLQFADTLIHIDLPVMPNVVEQRIGRLDRYGFGGPIDSWVLCDGHELSLSDAWLTWLRDGFGVFRNSIASLQFITRAATDEALDTALADGATGLRSLANWLPDSLRAELQTIEERESLDAIEAVDQDASRVDRFLAADAEWRELLLTVEGVRTEYGLGRDRLRYNSGCARYTVAREHSAQGLQRWDAERLEGHFGDSLGVYGTFARDEALALPSTRIRRLGERFIDRLVDLTETDDLGRCFATWRSSVDDEVLLLQCDLRIAPSAKAEAAVRRVAHRYLPERHLTLYVDLQSGRPLNDTEVIELLGATPPRGDEIDLDLQGEAWPLTHLLRREDWDDACSRALEAALAAASSDGRVVQWIAHALRNVDADIHRSVLQQAARKGAEPDPADSVFTEARAAVAEAAPRLDACGVTLLAPQPPLAATRHE